ncbi:hypothetical protein [Halarcobacter sp.]|uniref:hypothetical protein n=1 Tax=Halarcobacter sp. TaxID=2321133 RepID=UPI0029F5A4A3|nr:hypothetical protein [Halarcobacter sp.]
MNINIPVDSKIKIEKLYGNNVIVIPYENNSILKYLIGIFILFWLGGWFMGFLSAINQIMLGKAETFLFFWLGGWTIGGIFAGYMIFRIFRKTVPEQIFLNYPSLTFDSGIPPLKFSFNILNQKENYRTLFFKRKQIEFNELDIKSILLRETSNGNRLTLDKGKERIELAYDATEIEREWLYNYLLKFYRLKELQ